MKCKALFFFLLFPGLMEAQNLVPNWSFEEYDECPDYISQIERSIGWMSFNLTPDYFNSCAEPGLVGVPSNFMASGQLALHGNAYSGFHQFLYPQGHRELIGVELTDPLEVGQTYYLSFFVIRGVPNNSDCWSNRIGAQLTMQPYADWPLEVTMPISNAPHVYTDSMVSDTLNWTKIEGYFTADSAYQYLAIGNHFSLDSLITSCYVEHEFSYKAYYFLDCVCLAVYPEMCPECKTVTSSNDYLADDNAVLVFPNPFTDYVSVTFKEGKGKRKYMRLYGLDGQLITQVSTMDNYAQFDGLEHVSKGLYFIVVDFESGESQKIKLIKN